MANKILVVSWSVPPERTGSAVIIGNLARQFRGAEMVIAGERPHGRPDAVWHDDWPEIVYIASGWPATWRGARWWRRLQLPLMCWRALFLAIRRRCTSVVAVFPNEEYLITGYLTALLTRTSFFPYFHNTWIENRKGMPLRLAKWLQPRVLAKAKHVFLMSDGMVQLFKERYPDVSCSALVHSFNEALPKFCPPPERSSLLRFTISGNITESCQDATLRVCDAIFRTEGTELTFLTGTPRSTLARLGLLREGVRYDTVSHDQVVERLRDADIVVLPHGFTGGYSLDEYRTIFPTRTIEYLICGRPILAHSPPDCYLTSFLKENQCALVVEDASVAELMKAIELLASDAELRSKLIRNSLKAAERFEAPCVVAGFRARIEGNKHESHC